MEFTCIVDPEDTMVVQTKFVEGKVTAVELCTINRYEEAFVVLSLDDARILAEHIQDCINNVS